MRPETARAANAYRLALPAAPLSGRAGERLGRAAGSSLEFMDYRDYQPGDDLRHVDWKSYARTDQLKVRLYREEVAPAVDLVVDVSASLAVTPAKERALRDLAEAIAFWAARAGGTPRRLAAGGLGFADAEVVPLSGTASGALVPREPLRPRGLRVVLSDFLFEADPAPELRRLQAGAAELIAIQVLDPWEADPTDRGALALLDAESWARAELVLDDAAVAEYRQRLARLSEGVERTVRAGGGRFARVLAADPGSMFRRDLLAQGIVVPA